jgi:hypothetical protein
MAWIGAVVQGVTGIAQTIAASEAAKKLPEAQKYTPSPQMMRAEEMALRRAEQGMSAAERAAFEQGMARRTGAAERAMRNIGLAGVAQGVSNIFNIDAMNQFAAQSEAERRRGEQMYAGIAGQMQAIQDRETSSFNQMLQQQRTALGQAAASGMKNLTGAFGTAAQAYNTKQLADAYASSGDTYNYNLGGATTSAKTNPAMNPMSTTSGISAIGTGMTEQQGRDYLNSPNFGSMQFGQQTTSGLDQVYPMQSFYDPSAANAFNALSPNSSVLYSSDFSGFTSPGSATGAFFDQYNTQNMLDFGTTSGLLNAKLQ